MSIIIGKSRPSSHGNLTAAEAVAMTEAIIASDEFKVFRATVILRRYPELRQFRRCIINLALEEFVRRRQAGEVLSIGEFASEFSQVQQSLIKVIEIADVILDNPELIQEVPEDRWPVVDEIFCDFELEELIGRGAVSRVFVARQVDLKRRVVLKVCIRGEHEAALLGQLAFEGVVPIHSIHTEKETGLTAICMPYTTRVTMQDVAELVTCDEASSAVGDDQSLTGAAIFEWIRKINRMGGLESPLEEDPVQRNSSTACSADDPFGTLIIKWGLQLSRALEHAHRSRVLHCDVKPRNILVAADLKASLLDFNLASARGEAIRWAGGTLPYMASEQLTFLIESLRPDAEPERLPSLSVATDVYGLSATLWYLATGAPPFREAPASETRSDAARVLMTRQQQGISNADITKAGHVLPPAVVKILLRGLSLQPQDRFPSVSALAEELRSCLPSVITVTAPSRSTRWLLIPMMVAVGVLLAAAALRELRPVKTATPPVTETVAAKELATQQLIHKSAQLARTGDYKAAMEMLSTDDALDTRGRLLWLYCKTCETVPMQSGNLEFLSIAKPGARNKINTNVSEIERQWTELSREWTLLSRDSNTLIATAAECNLAWIYLDLKKFDQAVEAFQKSDHSQIPEATRNRLTIAISRLCNETQSDPKTTPHSVFPASDASRPELMAAVEAVMRALESDTTLTPTERTGQFRELLDAIAGTSLDFPATYAALFNRIRSLDIDSRVRSQTLQKARMDNLQIPENELSNVLWLPDF